VTIPRKERSSSNNTSRCPSATYRKHTTSNCNLHCIHVEYMQNQYIPIHNETQPLSSGWLKGCRQLSFPWSIKNPTCYHPQTDWLTRVLPTSQRQSDVNILAGSRTHIASFVNGTRTFLLSCLLDLLYLDSYLALLTYSTTALYLSSYYISQALELVPGT
jgi:hypothetical protein